MKNLFVRIIPMLMCVLFLYKQTAAQINLSQGLVLYLPFSGNANDASGNGNNGIVNGASLTADQWGNPNSAYYFDGIDDNIIVPHNAILNPVPDSGFSICAKVNMQGFYDGFCYNNAIVTKGNNQSWSSVGYYGLVTTQSLQSDCNFQDTTNHNYRFDFNGNGNALGTQVNAVLNNEPHIQLDQWDCLVGIFKNDTSYMYVNGVLRYKLSTYSKPGNTDNLSIGFDTWSSLYPFWFQGVIDEVRIYNRALSFEEVIQYCSFKPEDTAKPGGDPRYDPLGPDGPVEETTGLGDEVAKDNLFVLYPNPVKDVITLYVKNKIHREYTVMVTDVQGRVYKKNKFDEMTQQQLDVSDLADGIYFIKIEGKGITPLVKRIIVQK